MADYDLQYAYTKIDGSARNLEPLLSWDSHQNSRIGDYKACRYEEQEFTIQLCCVNTDWRLRHKWTT